MDYMKIGEMARLNDVSIQTLRYYDTIDLLKPCYIDHQTNYRYYHLSQSSDLDLILFLQALDFTLAEIKILLENPKKHDIIIEALSKKSADLVKQQQEMDDKNQMITSFKNNYLCYQHNEHHEGDITIEYFKERYIQSYFIEKNIYDMSLLEYEKYLRMFKLDIAKRKTQSHFFAQVGSLMKMDDFILGNFVSKELFLFSLDGDKDHLKVLPAGNYAVCYCHSFENELTTIKKLHNYLMKHHYKVSGDYICEVIHEFPGESKQGRNMFIRLQVPVTL